MKSPERDTQLITMLPLIGYRFGGYHKHGRGHQVLLWEGQVGGLEVTRVARHKFAGFVGMKLQKIKRL